MDISHEVPICLLQESRNFNNYDYALVHLFEQHEKYFRFFKESISLGRHVLLDNSIFELGTAFNADRYAYWIEKLQPTEYIIPDVLEDSHKTVDQARDWFSKYGDLPGKKIGVAQGKTYEEVVYCYQQLDKMGVDRIAISFDYSLYEEKFPHPNKLVSWMMGRVWLISKMFSDKVINTQLGHHLLGCSIPSEFAFYKDSTFSFITSLDTSNPIVLSLDNKRYEEYYPLLEKPTVKLFELIDTEMTTNQYNLVLENVKYFRKLVNLKH